MTPLAFTVKTQYIFQKTKECSPNIHGHGFLDENLESHLGCRPCFKCWNDLPIVRLAKNNTQTITV